MSGKTHDFNLGMKRMVEKYINMNLDTQMCIP